LLLIKSFLLNNSCFSTYPLLLILSLSSPPYLLTYLTVLFFNQLFPYLIDDLFEYPLDHLSTYSSFNHPLNHSIVCSFTDSILYPINHPLIHLLNYLLIHLFNYLLNYLITCSLTTSIFCSTPSFNCLSHPLGGSIHSLTISEWPWGLKCYAGDFLGAGGLNHPDFF
jgi:hypothetical protein